MSEKEFSLNTCDKASYLAVMVRQGMTLSEALESWEIARHGQSDIVIDGVYYRPDLEPTAEER